MKIALGNVAEGREADAGRGRTNEGIRGTRAYWYVVGCAADLQAAFRHSMRNVGMSSRKKKDRMVFNSDRFWFAEFRLKNYKHARGLRSCIAKSGTMVIVKNVDSKSCASSISDNDN